VTTPFISEKNSKIAVLFDLDGTLVNSLADICGVVNQVRVSFDLAPLPTEAIRVCIGKGVDHLMAGSIPELKGRTDLIEKFHEVYLKNPFHGGELYPNVRSVLEFLHGMGVIVAIATNKPSLVADVTLAHYLPDFPFALVAGPERVSRRKPAAEHLLEPLAQLGVAPEHAWFVGDDPVDLECARAAGVKFLGASYGFGGVRAPLLQQIQAFPDLLEKIPLPPMGI